MHGIGLNRLQYIQQKLNELQKYSKNKNCTQVSILHPTADECYKQLQNLKKEYNQLKSENLKYKIRNDELIEQIDQIIMKQLIEKESLIKKYQNYGKMEKEEIFKQHQMEREQMSKQHHIETEKMKTEYEQKINEIQQLYITFSREAHDCIEDLRETKSLQHRKMQKHSKFKALKERTKKIFGFDKK